MQFAQRGEREVDFVVVGILTAAECALDFSASPMTSNNWPSMLISLPSGSASPKSSSVGVGAKDDHGCAALVIDIAEPASGGHVQIEDIFADAVSPSRIVCLALRSPYLTA